MMLETPENIEGFPIRRHRASCFKLRGGEGFIMAEVVISIGIIAVILVAFAMLVQATAKAKRADIAEFRATLYLREGIEIAKDLEQSNWSAFTNPLCLAPLVCHPTITGSNWGLAGSGETLDDGMFSRTISVSPVYRDTLTFPNNIVSVGGVLDPNTKKVTASISWNNGYTPRVSTLETYVYQLP